MSCPDDDGGAAEFGLVLAFDSDDPEFTRGFEAGQVWTRLDYEQEFECYLSPGNAEMIMRICEAKGVAFTAEPCGEHWLWLRVAPKREANRHGGNHMTTPARLHIDKDGKLTGPAPFSIAYNDPFPCVNGSWGSGKMRGLVQHTMVGDLPGTIAVFNKRSYQASAHFGVAQDGSCHQFGPIGKGWIAWAQEAGNTEWYSCEFADHGDPGNPMTPGQIATGAQILECLSSFAGFPLQEANSVTERGYGVHYMGGQSWGGHSCPQRADGTGPRAGQRQAIIILAKQIRDAAQPQRTPGHVAYAAHGDALAWGDGGHPIPFWAKLSDPERAAWEAAARAVLA